MTQQITQQLIAPADTDTRRDVAYRPLVATGIVAAVAAAVATTVVAAVGRAAGISLDMAGEPIPVAGFTTLTLMFSLIGLAIAAVIARTASQPARAWVRVTVALVAVSFVPDLLSDTAVSTKLLLIATHLVAAAIVIPALARRLAP